MSEYFEVDGKKLKRKFDHCPKCGKGYFMGEHEDRYVCGRCGHTKWKKGKN